MFIALLHFAQSLVTNFGYSGVFFGMTLVALCIPIPSELTLGFAGYLVYKGQLNFWVAVLVADLGNIGGSTILYLVSRIKGRDMVLKYGKYFLINTANIEKADDWIKRFGARSVFIAQLLPAIGSIISIPAGALKMKYSRFITFTFLGGFIWCFTFIYLGTILGANWQRINYYIEPVKYGVYGLAAILLLYLLYNKLFKSKK